MAVIKMANLVSQTTHPADTMPLQAITMTPVTNGIDTLLRHLDTHLLHLYTAFQTILHAKMATTAHLITFSQRKAGLGSDWDRSE
jgi:hypothetical protein